MGRRNFVFSSPFESIRCMRINVDFLNFRAETINEFRRSSTKLTFLLLLENTTFIVSLKSVKI